MKHPETHTALMIILMKLMREKKKKKNAALYTCDDCLIIIGLDAVNDFDILTLL